MKKSIYGSYYIHHDQKQGLSYIGDWGLGQKIPIKSGNLLMNIHPLTGFILGRCLDWKVLRFSTCLETRSSCYHQVSWFVLFLVYTLRAAFFGVPHRVVICCCILLGAIQKLCHSSGRGRGSKNCTSFTPTVGNLELNTQKLVWKKLYCRLKIFCVGLGWFSHFVILLYTVYFTSLGNIFFILAGLLEPTFNLKWLFLSRNKLESFRSDSFLFLANLQRLYLDRNHIRKLPMEAFTNLNEVSQWLSVRR